MVPIIGTKHQYNQLFYNKNQERLNSNAPKYAPTTTLSLLSIKDCTCTQQSLCISHS